MRDVLTHLRTEAERELTRHILPFWATRAPDGADGFVGRITGANVVEADAPRGAVLNARLLWTFAIATRVLGDERHRSLARRACDYLTAHFVDGEHGGVYWMVDHQGAPLDVRKLTYAQAFALYALAECYRLTAEPDVLEVAVELFELVERHAGDPVHGGYFEVFTRDWQRLQGERLSKRDPVADKSANTQLHVLEAYSTLLRVWPSAALRTAQQALIRRFLNTIIDPRHHLHGAFDAAWRPVTRTVSYGHDIEASWLLVEAAEVVGDTALLAEVQAEAVRMAEVTMAEGVDREGGLLNEAGPDFVDDDRHWWPQAEAVVGWMNAYALTHDPRFLQAATRSWTFIQDHLVDRVHGEWFWRVSRDGQPDRSDDKAGPWKAPYHNARACLEVMRRAEALLQHPQRDSS